MLPSKRSKAEAHEWLNRVLRDGVLVEGFITAEQQLASMLDKAFAEGMEHQRNLDKLERAFR